MQVLPNFWQKFIETSWATRAEWRYSKDEILALYACCDVTAPFKLSYLFILNFMSYFTNRQKVFPKNRTHYINSLVTIFCHIVHLISNYHCF